MSLVQLGHHSEPVCLLQGRAHTYGASGLRCILSILCWDLHMLSFVLHSANYMPSVPHNVNGGRGMMLITRHRVQHGWGMFKHLSGSSLLGLLPGSRLLPGRLRLASILIILESGGHISRLLTGKR